MSTEISWFERNPKRTLLLFYLFLLVCLELLLRLLAAYGFVPITHYPTTDATKRFLADISEHHGVWHHSNIRVPSKGPCFEVVYATNSYGARDKEREKASSAKRRIVVLGDSFVEGIGVNEEERFTNLVEDQTGVEILNFGVSGDFSSTQEWLLYRELASKYDHSEIALFFLPANDFRDNDPTKHNPRRYRPYLRKTDSGDGFELYYPVAFEEREIPKGYSTRTKISRRIYNNVYIANLLRSSSKLIKQAKATFFGKHNAEFLSSYDRYSELDMERLLFGYRKLIEQANGRPVTIFIIPRQGEFTKFEEGRYPYKLIGEMEAFASSYHNVKVVDLLPAMREYLSENNLGAEELYLQCDGHWTALGNKVAAGIMLSEMFPGEHG